MNSPFLGDEPSNDNPPPHYYGNVVRAFMMFGGVVMLVTLPFFTDIIPQPAFLSIFLILGIVILSGLLSPRHKWLSLLDTLISAAGFILFEYYAISAAETFGNGSAFFLINQALALIFIVATYYGTKTVRSMFLD